VFRQRATARPRDGRVNVRAAHSLLGVLRVAQNDRVFSPLVDVVHARRSAQTTDNAAKPQTTREAQLRT
jgi:hypothetical protein